VNPDSTYHVKLTDGSNCMLKMKGWYPFMTWLVYIGVAYYRDGRAVVVFFSKMPDGTLIARSDFGLASRVVTEVPF
jgi:lysophospholipid acyltransferase (LPLAT)-like uncharacterized protein